MEQLVPTISISDALILQWLDETGEEELDFIAEELHEPYGHIMSRLMLLKRKGLIHVRNKYGELLVSLTVQGKQAVHYLWPEVHEYSFK